MAAEIPVSSSIMKSKRYAHIREMDNGYNLEIGLNGRRSELVFTSLPKLLKGIAKFFKAEIATDDTLISETK